MTDSNCPICKNSFPSETGVRDHAWDVHGVCHLCSEQFDDQHALYTHWLEAHDSSLSREARKRAERKVGDRTVCPVCSERFNSDDAVRTHAYDAHGACHRCGDRFDDQETLYTHWLVAHRADLSPAARDRAAAAVGPLSFGDRLAHDGLFGAMSGVRVSRRAVLGGGAAAGVALVGGVIVHDVLGDGARGTSLETHSAGTALGDQPTLGPTPGTAKGTIIGFEDPSCPSCARFELETFPELKSKLIEPGDVSFVFRSIPVVHPWGEPATLALEAVQARDEAAFWGLKRYYYKNQRGIDSDNVYEATRSYLAERTDLDGDAVVQDAKQGSYRDDVSTNLDTADQAGVRGTPTFFLFKSGTFTTSFIGPQSYSVFANTLGV